MSSKISSTKQSLNISFCRQVDHDCDFLEQERIMDYSLLVGVHFKEVSSSGEPVIIDVLTAGGIYLNFVESSTVWVY